MIPCVHACSVAVSASAWRTVDPENALLVETTKGRVIVELEPRLAPKAVERVKAVARLHLYDGLLMWRVLDQPGFAFVQTGDIHNHDSDRTALPDLKPEFTRRIPVQDIAYVRTGNQPEGFLGSIPVETLAPGTLRAGSVLAWGAYCTGVMGMGRDTAPDSANAEIFFMRGTTRYFDHDYTVVGRIVDGLAAIQSAAAGVPPAHPDAMIRVRVLADVPADQRPAVEVLDERGDEFRALAGRVKAQLGPNFSVCDVRVPSRVH